MRVFLRFGSHHAAAAAAEVAAAALSADENLAKALSMQQSGASSNIKNPSLSLPPVLP